MALPAAIVARPAAPVLVRGQHQHAAARAVGRHDLANLDGRGLVQRGQRFIEDPQGTHRRQQQTRQRHALALALGEQAHRALGFRFQSDFIQRTQCRFAS
jgi:hypothetical protein